MPTYPSGYSASSAIAMARARTGQTSGQPTDDQIRLFLNSGIENVERRIGAIYANQSLVIAQGANSIVLPSDLQSIININFSLTLPTATSAVLYPIRIVQE